MGISIWQLVIVLVMLPLAFLPTIIAIKKNHKYKIAIILVNIFGGFLWGLGWLVALVWCFIEPDKNNNNPSDPALQIEKLHKLKEKGALTEEEFEYQKKNILKI